MPIKPENKSLYPDNWKTEIRPAILERAGNCCEHCGKPHMHTVRAIRKKGIWFDEGLDYWRGPDGDKVDWPLQDEICYDLKVVITIAHLDHDPTNNDDANLAALCQRCHFVHDLYNNRQKIAKTVAGRRKEKVGA